jgi:hypothetical protein
MGVHDTPPHPPVQPKAPPSAGEVRRVGGGVKDSVLSALRVRPGTLFGPASTAGKVTLAATQAHALPGGSRRVADAGTSGPALSDGRRRSAFAASRLGDTGVDRTTNAAHNRVWMKDHASAVAEIGSWFAPDAGGAGPAHASLMLTLLPQHGDGPKQMRQMALAGALAIVSNGDVQRAAQIYRSLTDTAQVGSVHDTLVHDAFAVRRLLATTGLGVDALLLELPASHRSSNPREAETQLQAEITAHAAAERLLANWPKGRGGPPRPASLEQLALVANELVQAYPRSSMQGELHDEYLQPLREDDRASLLENNTSNRELCAALRDGPLARDDIALKALIGAVRLRSEPAVELHKTLRVPYLAARNHIYDQRELDAVGERLFKLLTYADRAASSGVA